VEIIIKYASSVDARATDHVGEMFLLIAQELESVFHRSYVHRLDRAS